MCSDDVELLNKNDRMSTAESPSDYCAKPRKIIQVPIAFVDNMYIALTKVI